MNTKYVTIHYGELALKGKNRKLFEKALADSIRSKLGSMPVASVRRLPGRIVAEFAEPAPWKNVSDKLQKVFGFSGAYPVERTEASLRDLENKILSSIENVQFGSFAVRTKRADKNFPYGSMEVNKIIGAAINIKSGAKVDLTKPEKIFKIEVLQNEIFFSTEFIKGAGGLPSGASGHAALLLSGGIDSPVAGWMMMKRGLKLSFIHFHSAPFTDEASIEKVEEIAELLNEWQNGSGVIRVPFGELQKKIVTSVPSKYRVLLYRRFMLRIASKIAAKIGAGALVTGESLGQVASQTLPNMAAIENVSDLPVLRPLIGLDKQEIIDISKKIGTYNLSIRPHQDCCSFLQPPNPATKSTVDELDRVEQVFNVDQLIEEVLASLPLPINDVTVEM